MNGSGKSSILQAIGFARYFAEGRAESFFEDRAWNRQDLKFRSNSRTRDSLVTFGALFDSPWGRIRWDFSWSATTGKTQDESVKLRRERKGEIETLVSFSAREGGEMGELKIPPFQIAGSILSIIPFVSDHSENDTIAHEVHSWGSGIRSLELLAPSYMRQGTRRSPDDIGIKGDRLAGFLASLSVSQRSRVIKRLGRVYPISDLSIVKKRAGWIDLKVAEKYSNLGEISVAHMSDGFMRLLAICAIPELPDYVRLVLLDEIEDGIEPHILSELIELIREESAAQIITTSHSPLLLNGIPTQDIRIVSRNDDGRTIAVDAATLPTFKEGSDYLGAGELWASVDLGSLNREVQDLFVKPTETENEAFIEQISEAPVK